MRDVISEERHRGYILALLAIYSLLIKMVVPILWSLTQRSPLFEHTFLDGWWVAYLAIGMMMMRGVARSWLWVAAVLVLVGELIVIPWKLTLFLLAPKLDFWHLNWFINKSILLSYFVPLLLWFLQPQVRLNFKGRFVG